MASYSHGDNRFCVVWCRTAPWYGAAGMPSIPCTVLNALSWLYCFDETVTKNTPTLGLKTPVEGFLASKGQLGLILATVHFYDRAKL